MANQTINKELPLRKWGKKMITDWKQIIEGFQIEIDEKVYEVITNEMITKTSKSSKVYRKRILTIKEVETDRVEEVSSDSFKDLTFTRKFKDKVKRIRKPKTRKTIKEEPKPIEPQDEIKQVDYEQFIFKVQRETSCYSEESDNFPEFMQEIFKKMEDDLDLDSLEQELGSIS